MSSAGTCGSCHAELPEGARFCPSCGAAIEAAMDASERRVVTVLFADLAGFTTLADGRDPEAVKAFLDECFDAMVPVVETHGGTVDKIIGDELMAVFGTPVAHEDDPARAVHAAMELVATLGRIRPELILRVGVNTGEVLVGRVGPHGSRTVTGDTVNTAHRLVGVAGPSEILVGERTRGATSGMIRYEARGPYELRGKRDPVPAYVALGRRRTAGRPPEIGIPTRIVGRDDELARLLDLADESANENSVRFVQIIGEAGVGKTRLALELYRRVARRRPTHLLWGRGRPYGASDPWQPLGEALRPVFKIDHLTADPDAAREQVGRRVAELTKSDREPNKVGLARLADLLGLSDLSDAHLPAAPTSPARDRRHDEQAAVTRAVLEALGADRPVVLVLDDAHAIDPSLIEFLAALAPQSMPLLVALVTREHLDQQPQLADVEVERIELEPLGRDAAIDMIHVVLQSIHEHDLDEVVLGPSVEDRIFEATGGIPFLIEQVVQYLIDRKMLISADRRWEVAADFESVGLPDTARSMIDARVDALSPDQRHLLQNASVFGRVFWLDTAGALAGIRSRSEIEATATALTERGFLGEHVDDQAGDMTFQHAMVRDAIYASMPLAERALKHQQVADFLSEATADTPGMLIGQLAHHCERAVGLSRELGESVDDERVAVALSRVLRAAEDARNRDAEREAERWYVRASQIGTADPAKRADVAIAHAEVLIDLRRFDRASEILIELLEIESELDPPKVAIARTHLGVCRRLASDDETALECFQAARSIWHELADDTGDAFTLSRAGWAELVAGRPRAALPMLLRAHDIAIASGGPDSSTLLSLGWCEFLLGNNRGAREHLWQAATGFSALQDTAGVGWCFGILGYSLWLEGRIEQAEEIASSLLQLAGEAGPWSEGMMLTLLGACSVERGDVDTAADPLRRARLLFSEIDDPWGAAMVAVVSGMSARIQGRHDEARRILETGIEVTRASMSVGEEARLLAELSSLELDAGNSARGVELARFALDLIRSGSGDSDSELRSLVALGRERRQAHDLEGALQFFEEALELGDPDLPTSAWRRASSHVAMVQAELGDAVASRAAADQALGGAGEAVRTWTLAMRGDSAARRVVGDQKGAIASLRRVLSRLDDRPLAFLRYVRRDLTRLADAGGGS